MTAFTTITDAINHIADMCNLTMDGARWVYENTDCPAWDDEEFSDYDFMADSKIGNIPAEFI